ncbi:MAG: DNA polymerase III subunit delta [Kiritimatiellae bacterium]|nr:DNA polymerase III subunit delta [Kiritimatiellia bacterium]
MPKQEQVKPVHVCLIVGEDEFSVAAAARERIDRFVPPADQTLGLEIIDGQADIIAQALACLRQCLEAIRTVGFLGGRKVVWLRGVDFLSDLVIGRNNEIQETLQTLAGAISGGIPKGHLLIITALKVDARTLFYKACSSNGEIIEFNLAEKPWQRDSGALAFAMHAFKDAGLQIDAELIETFTQKVGTDTRQIMQEITKLATYLGDRREVRAGDIEEVTSSSRELFAWDLEDAVGKRDLRRSLAVLRQLLFQREEPIRMISGLETRFRHLLILREALDNRWIAAQPMGHDNFKLTFAHLPESLADQFKQALASDKGTPLHPFVAGKLAGQAARFTRPEIDQRRAWLLASRRQLVSSAIPGSLILEYLVLKLCRSRNHKQNGTTTHY